jgi:hypothetical protein
MNLRPLVLSILVLSSACNELPFLHHGASSGAAADAGADVDPMTVQGAGGSGSAGSDNGITDGTAFPGFGSADAATAMSNTADGIALSGPDAGAFSLVPPWGSDGGVGPDALGFTFPDPSSLPPASDNSALLALANDVRNMEVGVPGCGEPPTCYLRTIVATGHGHVYSARMSKAYPNDSCVTKVIDCDHDVLIGDSKARFGDATCTATSPQITLGFLLPQSLLFSWNSGQIWESTSGFKSEWTLSDAGIDSGTYKPIPGLTAKLWPAWSRFYWNGEVYGELLVALRHTVTHELAVGFALFDIRVRQ